MNNPLNGIKILDLSRLLPGPYCSMILADMGAEVIKIEDTGAGDYFRDWEPVKVKNSVYFIGVNRNKKSVTLNLKTDQGREILYKLVASCDVVIESFRPGVTKKLGIDFDTLKKYNDKIIYASITGYGQNTSLKNKAGHDLNYLALSGILSFSGTREGKLPVLGVQVADMCGAIFGIISILLAIIRKDKIKEAQYLDIAMLDGLYSFLTMVAAKYFEDGILPFPGSNLFNGKFACYNIYETKDGRFFTVGAIEDKFWNRFCEVIGKDDWKGKNSDEKLQDNFVKELKEIFKSKTFPDWCEIFSNEDICVEPVLNLDEALNSDFVKERDIVFEIDDKVDKVCKHIKSPVNLFPEPDLTHKSHPQKGEHTTEILKSLNYDDDEIGELKNNGII